jgi:hypothetical protein
MDRTVFNSSERSAFSGLPLAIVGGEPDRTGLIAVAASSNGLAQAGIVIGTE